MSSRNYIIGDSQIHVVENVEAPFSATVPVQDAAPQKRLPNRLARLKDADKRFIHNGAPWFKTKKGAKVTKSTPKKPKPTRKNRSIRIHSPPRAYPSQPPDSVSNHIRSVYEHERQTSYPFDQTARNHVNPFQRSQSESSWDTVDENSSDMMTSSSIISSDYWSHIEAYMVPPSPLSALPRVVRVGPDREIHSGHFVAPPMPVVPEVHHGPQGLIPSQVSTSTGALNTFITPAPQTSPSEYQGGNAMLAFQFQGYSSGALNYGFPPALGAVEYFNEREVEINDLPHQFKRQQPDPELLGYFVSDPRGNDEYTRQYAPRLPNIGVYGSQHVSRSIE